MHFSEIHVDTPVPDQLAGQYEDWKRRIDSSPDATLACVLEWDDLRRRISSWLALVELHFNQDTSNEAYRQARKACDQLRPKLTELDVDLKRRLLNEPARSHVEAKYGPHVTRCWEVEIVTFDPVIADDLVEEATLEAAYNELLASAELTFQGQTYNLSGISQFAESPDRTTRHDAAQVQWQWFADHGAELDRIFDELVKRRHTMAKKLGFDNYVQLGYHRMMRIDYDQDDVARYRESVRQRIVPLSKMLLERQARRLGLEPDDLKQWDETIFDASGNPRPIGGHDMLIQSAQAMFDGMGYGLDSFFRVMCQADLMDLKNRPHKAGGGFCTSFDHVGLPYIFANFNGTKGDVEVFTHEMGHAFQCYQSRNQPLQDYLWPSYESCEIHSMGLEFLTYPFMDKFFGEDAERFRTIHLTQALLFLPYGVSIDHFQHLVYESPDASPAERFGMWREMEQTYQPWRNWGDMPHGRDGGRWQLQRHVYLYPFYYFDYTLAQTCALQFWVQASIDREDAMRRFADLCRRGGEAPFQTLAEDAGLTSPFVDGCLDRVAAQAEQVLLT